MKYDLVITGMSCAMCSKRVEKALLDIEGVETVSVDHTEGTASVDCQESTSLESLKNAVTNCGYEVV